MKQVSNQNNKGYIDSVFGLIDCIEIDSSGKRTGYCEGISELVSFFQDIRQKGNNLYFIGNGGSAAIANHMSADFMKNGHCRTISLYDSSIVTCLGNDYGYEYVFSKQIEYIGREDDVLVAISSSGESQNIVNAIDVAHARSMVVFSLTGFKPDNRVRMNSDMSLYVPSESYGMVESVHNLALQQIVDMMM